MKKLFAWYKDLPKEAKYVFAAIGLGTPAGILYLLQRYVFPGVPYQVLLIASAVLIVLIAGLCWLVSVLFSSGRKKRARRMASDLSRDDQIGPASMDVKASIKSNNEKFFNAVRDMKKNLGVNVYDLPWYIVIGDSGCGKTRLINNGGLTFSTGKPEGYQLGTLNYNWWFTEDAVFIDMAGRLCNPQEDSDRREWQAFLDTIAKGRPGFPVNGAFVCISAEHLLSDSPEKHEADANTALERLRDLQGKLGVTFATYLIITKCDKILGFMQFFDRAERDITVKNQIFGWSKEGEFNHLYDPEHFRADFASLYARLNDLRLRRMHDDASDADLGLAYSFPEEFREILDPLQTYVRTLFPMIRNPRAMKNLIFRGIYFTSATQEGAVILKHLAQRLGAEAADQFPSLDQLYPEKRPLFVKEVFFRKAFPEQGLVFRNENDVVRSQKLAKVVKIGSVALSLVLIALLSWSYLNFTRLMRQPAAHAKEAALKVGSPDESLSLGGALREDIATLNANQLAQRILSFPFAFTSPAELLMAIRAGAYERSQVEPRLKEAEAAMTTAQSWSARGDQCRDALGEYVKWWSCADAAAPTSLPDRRGFEQFLAVLPSAESLAPARDAATGKDTASITAFAAQTEEYFSQLPKLSDWRNPFDLLPGPEDHRFETFKKALQLAHDQYWRPRATLSPSHENPWVRNWMTIDAQCKAARAAYDDMLSYRDKAPQTREDWQKLQVDFAARYHDFNTALDGVKWETSDPTKGELLRKAVANVREGWFSYRRNLIKQSESCGAISHPEFRVLLDAFIGGGSDMDGLDKVLCQELKTRQLWAAKLDCDSEALGNLPGEGLIREVSDAWNYMVLASGFEGANLAPAVVLTEDSRALQTLLGEMSRTLGAAGGSLCIENADPLNCWNGQVATLLKSAAGSGLEVGDVNLAFSKEWQKPDLKQLQLKHREWLQQGQGSLLLAEIAGRLEQTGQLGLAELFMDRDRLVPSAYQSVSKPAPVEEPAAPVAELPAQEPAGRTRTRTRQADAALQADAPAPPAGRGRDTQPAPPSSAPRSRESTLVAESNLKGDIPAWLTHKFLDGRLVDMSMLANGVAAIPASHFHAAQRGGSIQAQCMDEIDRSSQRYVTEYVTEWVRLYEARSLSDLKPASEARDWTSLAALLGGDSTLKRQVQDDITAALGEILQAIPYVLWYLEGGTWGEPSINRDNLYWNNIRTWRNNALSTAAPGRWTFLSTATLGDEKLRKNKDVHPVQVLAGDVGQTWARLADAIAAAREIPRRFNDQSKTLAAIPWDGIRKLRENWGLRDEKLTGEIVALEERAKSLLDAELNAVLIALQGAHGLSAGASLPSGQTNLSAFMAFLTETAHAQRVLQGLEEGLAALPGSARRKAFYERCREWRVFLAGQDSGGSLSLANLGVSMTCEDPASNPGRFKVGWQDGLDATPAIPYLKMQLQVGLVSDKGAPLSDEETTWGTQRHEWPKAREGFWNWSSSGEVMKFRLYEGAAINSDNSLRLESAERKIGSTSPFSLVEYLLERGTCDDTRMTWYVGEQIDLRAAFSDPANQAKVQKLDHKRMNMGFVFRLNRRLPDRISPL